MAARKPPEELGPDIVRSVAVGWETAVSHAVLALAVVGLLCELLAFGFELASEEPLDAPVLVARIGGLLFYAAHHVAIVLELPPELFGALSGEQAPRGPSIGGSVAFAILGVTVVGLAALARGGRAVATRAGGTRPAAALHGLKVAVPYSLTAGAFSYLVRFTIPAGEWGPQVHPSHAGAFLWPLLLASIAGLAGGVRATEGPASGWTGWERRARGALAGAWRMLLLSLSLAFTGLLVLAVARPEDTRAYFDAAFGGGPGDGALVIALTVLLIPNMAVWLLHASMGGCTTVTGGLDGCFLSYTQFPATGTGRGLGILDPAVGGDLPSAPAPYLLFLLVPLVATVAGGLRAARRGQAGSRGEGATLGALAGVAFALLSLLAAVLATIVATFETELEGLGGSDAVRIGPAVAIGVALAMAWGVTGGALGGAAATPVRRPRATDEAEPPR